ncbi:hypothetical protein [Lactiplantibacillus plantarum]|uniref:hypothetical protein n=1 Tax=Lactiplantibacillus plantarum TaxID=1590 RepID=UPI00039DDFCB|nr:hypothetical protein [Lactiplantibacillus plantarum]AGL63057.2 peptidase M10 [Lactiplantibacillus plantarum subsp. plantarum P-8]MCG0770409.1 putative extracellular zinc metalloproteinase (putative) [Lactiplantibacillus plantarum]MCG0779436.1 putative extracellular zinc metalloproteinase (putative) [Lactiplantibacillus plantarum]MCG0789188.1 putative extracellular zinc metalloproteinase (putative) [Lactiplantibacillus plantarum]MCG0795268.1 putative extracellular zinc metalloproteinase (put
MKNKYSAKLGLTTLTVIFGLGLTPIANAKSIATPYSRSRWPHAQVTYVIQHHHTSGTSIKWPSKPGMRLVTLNSCREPLLIIKLLWGPVMPPVGSIIA